MNTIIVFKKLSAARFFNEITRMCLKNENHTYEKCIPRLNDGFRLDLWRRINNKEGKAPLIPNRWFLHYRASSLRIRHVRGSRDCRGIGMKIPSPLYDSSSSFFLTDARKLNYSIRLYSVDTAKKYFSAFSQMNRRISYPYLSIFLRFFPNKNHARGSHSQGGTVRKLIFFKKHFHRRSAKWFST